MRLGPVGAHLTYPLPALQSGSSVRITLRAGCLCHPLPALQLGIIPAPHPGLRLLGPAARAFVAAHNLVCTIPLEQRTCANALAIEVVAIEVA